MTAATPPVFGKRQTPQRTTNRPSPALAPIGLSPEQVALAAAARAEFAAERDDAPRSVPRSTRAALLSGLVVGCALAGVDASGNGGAAQLATLANLLGINIDASSLLPGLILLGLVGGARASAVTVIAVHKRLSLVGETRLAAYAAGGAATTLALAAVLTTLGHPPAHGWAVEAATGLGAGFFYRVFAGSRSA